MGSTTPTNGLPYPVGTDRVMDGDDAIAALALALDPPWVALPLGANMSARAGFAVPGCRLVGTRKVELRGGVQKTTAFANVDVLGTLPANMRPTIQAQLPIAGARTATPATVAWRLDVAATTGVLTILVDANPATVLSIDGVVFWLS